MAWTRTPLAALLILCVVQTSGLSPRDALNQFVVEEIPLDILQPGAKKLGSNIYNQKMMQMRSVETPRDGYFKSSSRVDSKPAVGLLADSEYYPRLRRNSAQAGYKPPYRGRYRGQTQSQYLNVGESTPPGRAEAESGPDGSRAVVSGNRGMGQAQSQSGFSSGCEDCDTQSQKIAWGDRSQGYPRGPGGFTDVGGEGRGKKTSPDSGSQQYPAGPGRYTDRGYPITGGDGKSPGTPGGRGPTQGGQGPIGPYTQSGLDQGGQRPGPGYTQRRPGGVDQEYTQNGRGGPSSELTLGGGRTPEYTQGRPSGPGAPLLQQELGPGLTPGGQRPSSGYIQSGPSGPGSPLTQGGPSSKYSPGGQIPDTGYSQGGQLAPSSELPQGGGSPGYIAGGQRPSSGYTQGGAGGREIPLTHGGPTNGYTPGGQRPDSGFPQGGQDGTGSVLTGGGGPGYIPRGQRPSSGYTQDRTGGLGAPGYTPGGTLPGSRLPQGEQEGTQGGRLRPGYIPGGQTPGLGYTQGEPRGPGGPLTQGGLSPGYTPGGQRLGSGYPLDGPGGRGSELPQGGGGPRYTPGGQRPSADLGQGGGPPSAPGGQRPDSGYLHGGQRGPGSELTPVVSGSGYTPGGQRPGLEEIQGGPIGPGAPSTQGRISPGYTPGGQQPSSGYQQGTFRGPSAGYTQNGRGGPGSELTQGKGGLINEYTELGQRPSSEYSQNGQGSHYTQQGQRPSSYPGGQISPGSGYIQRGEGDNSGYIYEGQRPVSGYPQSGDRGYPQSGDRGYLQSGDRGYPQSGDRGYPQSGDRGYPQSGDRGYPQSGDRGYPQSGDRGYPQSGDSGYPQSGDRGYSQSNQRPGIDSSIRDQTINQGPNSGRPQGGPDPGPGFIQGGPTSIYRPGSQRPDTGYQQGQGPNQQHGPTGQQPHPGYQQEIEGYTNGRQGSSPDYNQSGQSPGYQQVHQIPGEGYQQGGHVPNQGYQPGGPSPSYPRETIYGGRGQYPDTNAQEGQGQRPHSYTQNGHDHRLETQNGHGPKQYPNGLTSNYPEEQYQPGGKFDPRGVENRYQGNYPSGPGGKYTDPNYRQSGTGKLGESQDGYDQSRYDQRTPGWGDQTSGSKQQGLTPEIPFDGQTHPYNTYPSPPGSSISQPGAERYSGSPGLGPSSGGYDNLGKPTGLDSGVDNQWKGYETGYPGRVSGGDYSSDNDDTNSQAETSIQQIENGTQASASSVGTHNGGSAQSQISGSYTGSGSFSAQAQTLDANRGAQSQISVGKDGAISSAQGKAGQGQSQAQLQLGSDSGSTVAEAQSGGWNHGTNTQVQASSAGGLADAQASGPGSTSSQAQIGFQPQKENEEDTENSNTPFYGGGTASAQSGNFAGQSQTQIHGKFKYGISYTGAAQAGSGSKDFFKNNRTSIKPLDVFSAKTIRADRQVAPQITNIIKKDKPTTEQTVVNESMEESETKNFDQTHIIHNISNTVNTTDIKMVPSGSVRNDMSDIDDGDGKDNQNLDEYPDIDDEDYDTDFYQSTEATHRSLQSKNPPRDVVFQQTGRGQKQHILLGSYDKSDLHVAMDSSSDTLKEGMTFQPGEVIPGTQGYTIPIGFRGRVSSVSQGDDTYAYADKDGDSQAQSITITPRAGNVSFSKPLYKSQPLVKSLNLNNQSPKRFVAPDTQNRNRDSYVTVTKSVTGELNADKTDLDQNKKFSHTYYTKSSTCGFFTFTCNLVYGSNGRIKVCKPDIPKNPDGTPMQC